VTQEPVVINPPAQPAVDLQPATDIPPAGDGAELSIPSTNDTAPNGVLDQLAWSPQGGGGLEEPCGNCEVTLSGQSLSLSNFQPAQRLSLLVYRTTGTAKNCMLLSTAEYVTTLTPQVGEDGNASITLSGTTDNLIVMRAYDAATRKLLWKTFKAKYAHEVCHDAGAGKSCSGAPAQRVSVGKKAYVCTASEVVLLRKKAGKKYDVLKSLYPGADLDVIGGPVCSDHWSWWQVRTESGFVGWISEGGDDVDPYFICPK